MRPADFQEVFNQTNFKISGVNFLLLARCNELAHPRLGVAIAKKKVRRAVDRNRLKRQIRDCFRLNQNQIPAVDIVFLARQEITMLPLQEFRSALEQAWKQLKLKHKSSVATAIEAKQ